MGGSNICIVVEASRAAMLTGARESQHKHHQQIAQKIHAATSRRRDGALATPLHRDRRRESQLEAAQYFRNPTTLRQLKTRRTSAPSSSNGVEQVALSMATSLHASISLESGDKAAGPTAETSVPMSPVKSMTRTTLIYHPCRTTAMSRLRWSLRLIIRTRYV